MLNLIFPKQFQEAVLDKWSIKPMQTHIKADPNPELTIPARCSAELENVIAATAEVTGPLNEIAMAAHATFKDLAVLERRHLSEVSFDSRSLSPFILHFFIYLFFSCMSLWSLPSSSSISSTKRQWWSERSGNCTSQRTSSNRCCSAARRTRTKQIDRC